MPSARFLVALICLSPVVSGCAQSNPLISHRSTLGSLKTSVSQLEFENRQLKQKVADLQSENRQIEDRLVQEESINGDLSARLDDAKALLGQRGIDPASDSGSVQAENAPTAAPKTLPAGRSTRRPRKPPFAQIPGRIEKSPAEPEEPPPSSGWKGEAGPQSRREDDMTVWLPVARAPSEAVTPRRK